MSAPARVVGVGHRDRVRSRSVCLVSRGRMRVGRRVGATSMILRSTSLEHLKAIVDGAPLDGGCRNSSAEDEEDCQSLAGEHCLESG